MSEDLISTSQALEIMRVTTTDAITKHIRNGKLPYVLKVGAGYVLRRSDVIALRARLDAGKNQSKVPLKKEKGNKR